MSLSAVCVREHSSIGEPEFRAVSNRPRPGRYTPETTGTPGPGLTHALVTLAGITLTEHPGHLARETVVREGKQMPIHPKPFGVGFLGTVL